MHTRLLLFAAMIFTCSLAFGQKKVVLNTHADGSPQFVVYVKGKDDDAIKLKEEVFYENGNLEYVGHFNKDGEQHGEWIYYFEDGTMKYKEKYKNGKKDGVQYEYHTDGQLKNEEHYKDGELSKRIEH